MQCIRDDSKLNEAGAVFAALINHPRMDFILMRRHRRLVWPRVTLRLILFHEARPWRDFTLNLNYTMASVIVLANAVWEVRFVSGRSL